MYDKEKINKKYEYTLKQLIYTHWRHIDITGKETAIKRMKQDFELLKKHNPKSKYIPELQNFIESKEG